MCGQSGTFDPFWDDLGSFMTETHVIDRELLLLKYGTDLCKNQRRKVNLSEFLEFLVKNTKFWHLLPDIFRIQNRIFLPKYD
jgi:hypothetical protein